MSSPDCIKEGRRLALEKVPQAKVVLERGGSLRGLEMPLESHPFVSARSPAPAMPQLVESVLPPGRLAQRPTGPARVCLPLRRLRSKAEGGGLLCYRLGDGQDMVSLNPDQQTRDCIFNRSNLKPRIVCRLYLASSKSPRPRQAGLCCEEGCNLRRSATP